MKEIYYITYMNEFKDLSVEELRSLDFSALLQRGQIDLDGTFIDKNNLEYEATQLKFKADLSEDTINEIKALSKIEFPSSAEKLNHDLQIFQRKSTYLLLGNLQFMRDDMEVYQALIIDKSAIWDFVE